MATQDLTNTLAVQRQIGPVLDGGKRTVKKTVNFANVGGSAGDTYQLFDLPAGVTVLGGHIAVTAVFGAASSGTIQFRIGSANLSAAIDCNATAVNTVYQLSTNDYEDTAGAVTRLTAADTLDMVNATAIPATGVFDIYIEYIDG